MMEAHLFQGLRLHGGFTLVALEFVAVPLLDAVDRPSLAKTRITGRNLYITALANQSDRETSVTLYHEVLEAITVASPRAPASVQEFNEADFEQAGYEAHERWGSVTPEGLNRMLQFYDFPRE